MFRKQRYPYRVVVHFDGRHPYLDGHELDYPTRDVVLCVPAKDWNDAARQAMEAAASIPEKWSWRVKSVARAS